jgi:hypothetical protein
MLHLHRNVPRALTNVGVRTFDSGIAGKLLRGMQIELADPGRDVNAHLALQ